MAEKNSQTKEKILYGITKSNFGGAQRYVFDLATAMNKRGHDVAVLCGGNGLLVQKLKRENVRVITIPGFDRDIDLLNDASRLLFIIKTVRHEKPDIFHINSAKMGGAGIFSGRLLGVPKIIFTAHGWAFNEERSLFSKIIIKLLTWFTVALSHQIIAVSKNIADTAPKLFIPEKKISVIRNGVSLYIPLEKKDALVALGEKFKNIGEKESLNIVTMAELHKNKGLSYAIEAMSIIKKERKDISYTIFGEGEERKRLEKLVKRHNLSRIVRLAGFVDKTREYLRAFDIFLLPSITEALSISTLEAGVAGMPVIVTAVGGVPEIIEDMKTGILVRPKQPKELASAIKFLIDNPQKAAEFGKNLHDKVVKDFSLEEMLRKTLLLYRN